MKTLIENLLSKSTFKDILYDKNICKIINGNIYIENINFIINVGDIKSETYDIILNYNMNYNFNLNKSVFLNEPLYLNGPLHLNHPFYIKKCNFFHVD